MKTRLLLVAAMVAAMFVSCNKKNFADTKIETGADSLNYAFGFINGVGIRSQVIGNDTLSEDAINDFCKGFTETFGVVEGKDFVKSTGFLTGVNLAKQFNSGFLFNDSTIPANKDLALEAFGFGIERKEWIMTPDSAMNFIRNTIGMAMFTGASVNPSKEDAETLNKCIGYLNAIQARNFILGGDTTAKDIKNFMKGFKKGLNSPEKDSMYVRGMDIGSKFTMNLKSTEAFFNDSNYKVNYDAIGRGAIDGIRCNPEALMTTQEAMDYFQNTSKAVIEKQNEPVIKANREFLENNKNEEGVVETESGLQYKVITEGKGPKPTAESTVKVHYTGTLIDGTEFDSSVKRGKPAEFAVGQVIPGWTEGLQLMSVGSKYMLYIPYELGYGERGQGQDIPGFSTLIFEVELLEIVK